AVCAGHRNTALQAHEFREHPGARNYGDTRGAGREYFGVVRAHGGGNDDSANAFNVLRAVPNRYTGPQCLQPTRHGRGLQVRPADRVAQVEQDLCYAAHAGAANADEVDALYTVLHGFLRATCSQASAIKRVADRHACSWACSAT